MDQHTWLSQTIHGFYNDMHEASNYIIPLISYTALSINVAMIDKQQNVDNEILNYNLQHIANILYS